MVLDSPLRQRLVGLLALLGLLLSGHISAVSAQGTDATDAATENTSPEPVLGIGHPAPPLAVEAWYTGEPIEKLQSGQVYVVEFWATWCGPCLASMPHLSKLQTEYGDKVRMIGVTREDAETVEKFLDKKQSEEKQWKEVITYRLVQDHEGQMSQTYMRAAQQSGIPTAFIVGRDGRIDWIGHPASIDEPLAKVVAGTWDRDLAIAEFAKQQQIKTLSRQLSTHARAGEWDAALATLDEIAPLLGEELAAAITQTRLSLLDSAGRTEEATKLRSQLIQDAWDSAQDLNAIAWGITVSRGEKDLATAMKAAQRAVELTEAKEPAILDTLARVYFEQGELKTAIEWQTKAVDAAPENRSLKSTLKAYQKALEKQQTPDEPGQPEEKPAS
ncbi:MAG: redoxin domain-containing protein [Planctomycetaceae bacterium]|nr:redoxin domain-containing protein [Planctomycetaceae bacterium]